jgi:putative hemolysin
VKTLLDTAQNNSFGHACRSALENSGRIEQLEIRWASSAEDVRKAQHLRYQIFGQEMGAKLDSSAASGAELDIDFFDAYCDHLLVWANTPNETETKTGTSIDREDRILVGTYRVLGPAAAKRAGGFYTDTEFDLTPLAHLRETAVELGRSCVHPDWRTGRVIMALWSELGVYMRMHGLDTMIGCASIPLEKDGQTAAQLWHRLQEKHLVAAPLRVRPLHPFQPANDIDMESKNVVTDIFEGVPPLIKGYLRCGAQLLGPPALDLAFNCADLPLILQIKNLSDRYRKHFLGNG